MPELIEEDKNEFYKISEVLTQPESVNSLFQTSGLKYELEGYKSPYNLNEQNILRGMETIANKVSDYNAESVGFYNLPLIQILKNVSTTLLDIINEVSIVIYAPIDARDVGDNYEYWWINAQYKIREIFVVLTKGSRLIYLGIFLIALSIVVYFIEISS